MTRDAQVVAAAWDEADASLQADDEPEVLYIADGRSVVVKRSAIDDAEQPISERRFVQLPDDPFDEEAAHDNFFDEPADEPEFRRSTGRTRRRNRPT